MKTEPKYRTFDELLNEVATDFVQYNNEGMIEPGQLIKVAQRVNYDLGLRIHGTKEKILDIEKKKTKLPDDFYVLNYAMLCGHYTVLQPILHGRQTENVILDSDSCNTCGKPHACDGTTSKSGGGAIRDVETFTANSAQTVFTVTTTLTSNSFDVYLNGIKLNSSSYVSTSITITLTDPAVAGDIIDVINYNTAPRSGSGGYCDCKCDNTYTVECKTGEKIFVQVVEKTAYETKVYKTFERIHISSSTGKKDSLDNTGNNGYIKNGFLYTNIEEGKLYLSYQGALEDEDGNLLVLDHPMINEYYEYALKQRLLENLFMSGEEVSQKMQLVEQRLRAARNNALSIVNTPDFAEMKQLWETNRKAQYGKYYDMFKSGYGW
jgi:hypothetical protein